MFPFCPGSHAAQDSPAAQGSQTSRSSQATQCSPYAQDYLAVFTSRPAQGSMLPRISMIPRNPQVLTAHGPMLISGRVQVARDILF
jgi:hypothetical protein